MNIPRIVIAGTNSGCGKTTVSTGIMGVFTKRGLKVQAYKVGPDYIDPMFHSFITGKASRNLDSWLLDEATVSYLFYKNSRGADIAVVEGVMGIYDGYGGYSEGGSTAHVAKIIDAPVILVVNGDGMSLSIAALIKGFLDFDKNINIKGVIINNVSNEAHFQLLKEIIQEHLDIAVIGYLRNMKDITLKSRHLGLIPEGEIENLSETVNVLSCEMEKTIDFELLFKIACEQVEKEKSNKENCIPDRLLDIKPVKSTVRIAVARDSAFNFYYMDNLDLLEMLGAELIFFSPMKDSKLPDGISGLYFGGGYPEVWASELQNNIEMKSSIRDLIKGGLPAYAECGGLMYLSEGIENSNCEKFEMVGIIPGMSKMTGKLQRFGYIEVDIIDENVLADIGEKIRGHEFHFSNTEVTNNIPYCYRIAKSRRSGEERIWYCGFKLHNLLAGYPHLHFWSNISFARRFLESCIKFGQK